MDKEKKFFCPVCKSDLNIPEAEKAFMGHPIPAIPSLSATFYRKCNKCSKMLVFDNNINTFVKLNFWGKLLRGFRHANYHKTDVSHTRKK